jgi:protease-4
MTDPTLPDPGTPGRRPPARPYGEAYLPREGRPVSFYLAIFLGLLLFVSGGLNVLLLVVSVFGSATAGLGGASIDDGDYQIAVVDGDREAQARLLRVPIEGAIAEASSPVIGAAGGTVSQVRRALRFAARDERVKGVLLDINSPGGGVTDSDLIWQAIDDFKRETKKPVLALFGDMAASGGYYVAAACDRIVARPTTITGSIGVILSNLNFVEAAAKFGIHQENVVSARTPYKDIMSPWRPMDDAEREILRSIVDEMYDRFVDVVDAGRPGLSRERVVELADGRIYSAQQALDTGLVDEVGDADDAYATLRRLCSIDEAQVVEQRRLPTLTDLLFGRTGAGGTGAATPSVDRSLATLLGSSTGAKFLYYWPGGR